MTQRRTPIPPSSPDAAEAPDPLVEAQIQRSLRPFVGKVPPAMLARMRANLEEALTTHPTAIALLDSLRDGGPRRMISGQRLRDGVEVEEDDDEASGSGAS